MNFIIFLILFKISSAQGYVRENNPFPVYINGELLNQPFTGGLNQPDPRFMDWNGDNILDCFINDRDGHLQYWEGLLVVIPDSGTVIPHFELITKSFQDLQVGSWYAFADFDEDGDDDLLTNSQGTEHVSYWRNANGFFTLETNQLYDIDGSPVYGGQIVIPAITDIDNDGHTDLFVGDVSGRLTYYKGHSISGGLPQFELITNLFEEIQIVWTPGRHGANAIEFFDLDNDNDLDLIWGDFYQPGLFYLENYGTATTPDFDHTLMITDFPQGIDFETTGHNIARFADFDNDGDGDMVVGVLSGAYGTEYLENLYYFQNNGTAENASLELLTSRLLSGLDFISGSHPAVAHHCVSGATEIWIGTEQNPSNPNWNGSLLYMINNGTEFFPEFYFDSSEWFTDIGSNLVPAFFNSGENNTEDLFLGEFNGTLLKINQFQDYPFFCIFGLPENDFLNIDLSGRSAPAFGDIDQDGDDDLVVGDKHGVIHIYWNMGNAGNAIFDSNSILNIDIGENVSPVVLKNGHILAGNKAGDLYEIVYNEDGELIAENRNDIPYMGINLAPAAIYWNQQSDPDLLFGTQAGGLQYFRFDSTVASLGDAYAPRTFKLMNPYPNPMNDHLSFNIHNDSKQNIEISLMDIRGRLVKNIYKAEMNQGQMPFSIKADFPSGVYFIQVQSSSEIVCRKFTYIK